MWLDLPAIERQLTTRLVGRRLIYLTSTGSTMDVARLEAESGGADGTIVIAEEQTAGRGRFGRNWVSPGGKNLYFTLLLRPEARLMRPLSIVAPLAICRAIEGATALTPSIKWPNDVLLGGRKVSGVLIESETEGGSAKFALVGIGVNVNFDIPADSEIASIATSVKTLLGRETPREDLLAAMLNSIEELLDDERAGGSAIPAWKERLETLGRRVTVTFQGETEEGTAEDVDDAGNLLLRTDDGRLMTMEAGEVTLRPPETTR
jgi:BirA family biotin operon repressor/biotin-[acetyl-CoA-carboxylase] ligase